MNQEALKELLYKMADDQLILGHRNSEWTGMGPLLEEDIAFSSMAQDKVGHSLVMYQMLHQLGENDPDTVAFMRHADQFHNCQFVELPIGEYDFSLIRHFLFDHGELIRFELLAGSSYEPLSLAAKKLKGELRYHKMHADVFIKKLGNATTESITRMQGALDQAFPYAMGIYEPSPFEEALIGEGIFKGEINLQDLWLESIAKVLHETELNLPDPKAVRPVFGGRTGNHTEHLQPLLDEMAEVFRVDPTAEW